MSLSTSQLVSGGLFLVASLSHLAKVFTTTQYPFAGDFGLRWFCSGPSAPPKKKIVICGKLFRNPLKSFDNWTFGGGF